MLRAMVDTPNGRERRIIRGPADAERVAGELAATDAIEWPYPPVYGGSIRYRRENTRGHAEDWKDADRLCRDGFGDCEDLAAARVGELVASGIDPDARPMVYRPRPGLMHVVVRRGDGAVEDPSAVLGMGRMGKVLLKSRRLRRGSYEVGIGVPYGDTHLATSAIGTSRADAAKQAFGNVIGLLDEFGAFHELCDCGWELPPKLRGLDEVGLERMTDADFDAWRAGVGAKVEELRTEWAVPAGRILDTIVHLPWNDWQGDALAFGRNLTSQLQQLTAGIPVAGPALSWLMECANWLCQEYPAVALMDWQNAFDYCAAGLGFRSGTTTERVGLMQQAGWVCGDAQRTAWGLGVVKPDGAPEKRSDLEEAAIVMLAPRGGDFAKRQISRWAGSLADWTVGLERTNALLDADALRSVTVQSKRNIRHEAICMRLDALPADVLDLLALYYPLAFGGGAAALRTRGVDPICPDNGVRALIDLMTNGGFDASGGGQGFAGSNPIHYVKVIGELRPGAAPLGGTPAITITPGGKTTKSPSAGKPAITITPGGKTTKSPSAGKPAKGTPAKGKTGAMDWSKLLLPAAALGALALMVAGDEEDENDDHIPVSSHRRQNGGERATNGRGARLATNGATRWRGATVPERIPALSPDTADRLAMMEAVALAAASNATAELRALCKANRALGRLARELLRG